MRAEGEGAISRHGQMEAERKMSQIVDTQFSKGDTNLQVATTEAKSRQGVEKRGEGWRVIILSLTEKENVRGFGSQRGLQSI